MIKFAICDDEPHMAWEISHYLAGYMEENRISSYHISSFSNGSALLEDGGNFDMIFLDIQMERPDGMETARLLRRRGNYGLLIFVTVLKEYVFDSFEVEAYDYLVKPVDAGHFRRTMDRALRLLDQRAAKTIVVQRGTACQVIPLAEIVYCEVLGRKIYIHKSDGEVVDYYDKLEDLERRVGRRFFKCHRSYLVNLDHVRGCRAGLVMLPQGESIPVSRLRERDLTQALLQHMKGRNF